MFNWKNSDRIHLGKTSRFVPICLEIWWVLLGGQGGGVVRTWWQLGHGKRNQSGAVPIEVWLGAVARRKEEMGGKQLTSGAGASERERERDARAWELTDGVRMSAARRERERLTVGRATEKGSCRRG